MITNIVSLFLGITLGVSVVTILYVYNRDKTTVDIVNDEYYKYTIDKHGTLEDKVDEYCKNQIKKKHVGGVGEILIEKVSIVGDEWEDEDTDSDGKWEVIFQTRKPDDK